MVKTSKLMKVLVAILIALTLATVLNTTVFATDAKEIIEGIGDKVQLKNDATLMTKVAGVVGWIRTIAVIAGLIMLTILGVKYIMASAEGKAEYKSNLIPLVIGIIVVMMSTQIAAWIFGSLT